MDFDCPRCNQIWREYVSAFATLSELRSRLSPAGNGKEDRGPGNIQASIVCTELYCERLRKQLRTHECQAHASERGRRSRREPSRGRG